MTERRNEKRVKDFNKSDIQNILLIGNPNVGKSTLFNSLTKAHEHTGNFHGVTVSEAKKIIKFENQDYCFYDLPGLYSMTTFSREEEVSKNLILSLNAKRIVVVDASALRRNLYLCLQFCELGLDFKILLNNYEYFLKHGNEIDEKKLSKKLNIDIEIINAKKQKLSKNLISFNKNSNFSSHNLYYIKNYLEIIKNKYNLTEKQIIFALNGVFDGLNEQQIDYIKGFYPEIIKKRYEFIENLLVDCTKIKKNYVYGENKLDKLILNPFFMISSSILLFFAIFYTIFFLLGPKLSDLFNIVLNFIFINPFLDLLSSITDNVWLIEFFSSGVFLSFATILSFLPQICLMYMVLTILEDSGIIARLCYVIDDLLSPMGLNGKVIYVMLMGLGCNTMATLTTRNLKGKNLKTKSAILNPYISCMARLPIFSIVASAFFGVKSFWIVIALYLLGIVISIILALILNKTILPTEQGELLLEFPPLKHIDIKHCVETIISSAVDMFKRLFTIVLSVGIIVWILTHTQFNFCYAQDITNSMAFLIADKVAVLFAPIGLNSAGVVCALFVGVLAKELVVSTLSICNNALSRADLISSLAVATSVVHFSYPSAISFMIFSLLYCPCVSNLAVLRAETDKFYMWFSIISQFVIAYVLSFIVYQSLVCNFWFALCVCAVIALIIFAMFKLIKTIKHNRCQNCMHCKR